MVRYFFKTIQGRVIGLFVIFMTITFAMSLYAVRYVSQNTIEGEKQSKLSNVAIYLEQKLGEGDYDDILAEVGAEGASREEKISALNRALAERTDEVASLFPGLGVGYYSLQLEAILTYGPSERHGDRVGVTIAIDHPGRTVMRENRDLVQIGTMVRGHIMNAMHPIVRRGKVIGYVWANELTSAIQLEYQSFIRHIVALLTIFFAVSLLLSIMSSRRTMRDIAAVIAGVNNMRGNLKARIKGIGGELGEVADNINHMAEDIEKNVEEHEALLRSEAANTAQREFLSHMSHEIRTPMNAIIGMTNIARKTGDAGKIQDYLRKIDSAANHLLGVINDVLDMSKIEAGMLKLSETSFSLRQMLDQVVTMVGFKMEEKSQNLTTEIDGDAPAYVKTDRQRLAQVITNLLGNANKFTPENGHICLRVKRLAIRDGVCRLRIEVQDDGIGISQEQQAKLFRSFAQADNGISRKYGGTGLGLVISKRIVELMNGRIWIRSEDGQGANFLFEIEVGIGSESEDEAASAATEDMSEKIVFAGKRILLAEDIEINREIVAALLEPTQVEIDCAENGAEAVRLFGASPERYDLIFMDVQMPHMDGYEATRQIRSLSAGRAKTVPIVAMTANVFKEDIEKCLAAGMNSHLGKPLVFDEVLAQLRVYFDDGR